MQYTVTAFMALMSLSNAALLPRARCLPSPTNACPATAKFDDLAAGTKLAFTPYTYLNWSDATVEAQGPRKLIPYSAPNYALSGPFKTASYPAPSFGIAGDTISFALDSFQAGCVSSKTNEPVKCQFIFQCRTADRHEGPYLYSYSPAKDHQGAAALQKYEPGFQYCVNTNGGVYTSDAGVENTRFAIDDVNIRYRKP